MSGPGADTSPYSGFRFTLEIPVLGSLGDWQTCSGLQIEYDLYSLNEGGLNTFSWRIPGRIKNGNSVKLTRAIGQHQEEVQVIRYLHMVSDRMSAGLDAFMPATIVLHHLSESVPPIVWVLEHAFPAKWTGPSLDVSGKLMATESLELAYHGLSCEGA